MPNPHRHDLALETLRIAHGGITQQEMSEALQAAKERAMQTGKAASVTLKITLAPDGRDQHGNVSQMEIKARVTQTLPAFDRGKTLVFATPDGYTRNDPSQPELPLRDVSTQSTTLRNAT